MQNKKSIILIICIAFLSIIALILVASYAISDSTSLNLDEILQKNRITMKSDYETVDSYKNFFENNNSKEDGKVWTDKSVYDYQKTKGNVTLDSNLTYLNGGNGFNINYNDEFLHVFSALGSSQRIEAQNIVDFLIVIDMSGSMGADVVDNLEHDDEETRIAHSRIQLTINSVNKTIESIMKENEKNRVCVVVYGASAYTLMELGHYQKIDNSTDYITVEKFMTYNEAEYKNSGTCAYTLRLKATKDGQVIERSVRNNYTNNMSEEQLQRGDYWIGYNTNLQAGIYLGFNELYNNIDSEIARNPIAIIMSDGGANYGLKRDNENPNVGDEWYDVPFPETVTAYLANYKMYRSEHNFVDRGGKEVILETLLTASYMKSKVLHKYEEVLKNITGHSGKVDFKIHTVSVDLPTAEWQVPRVYTTLDPTNYFKKELPNVDWDLKDDATNAYKLFEDWKASEDGIVSTFYDSDGIITKEDSVEYKETNLKINKLPGEVNGVTNEDVIDNINYNDTFGDIKSEDLNSYFESIIETTTELFSPVSDTNNQSALSYQDIIGENLEVKEVKKLLLFGKEYNIVLGTKDGNKQYYKAVGSNGEDLTLQNKNYLTPLKFKLSDIVIWTETDGTKETFNIKIPSAALPILTNKIVIDNYRNVLEYSSDNNTVNNLPIRVLYTVGLKTELIDTNSKVNLLNISDEYIEKNTRIIDGHEYIIFNSNYYNINNLYGDAKSEIVPSKNNIYYYYQENLPIYESSSGGNADGEGELKTTGGSVVLTNNLKKLTDIDKNKTYYYIEEYYVKTENGQKRVEYAIAVKGSDFYDENNNLKLIYYDTRYKKEVTNSGNNVVVATKVGSKKIKDQSEIINKKENVTNTSKYTLNLENQENSMLHYLGNNGELQIEYKGYLKIEKEVTGERGDFDKDWNFEVRLMPKEGVVLENTYQVKGESFIENVETPKIEEIKFIKQEDGTYLGNSTLKHGQSITIEDIPGSTSYQVIEKEANTGLYETVPTNDTGIVNRGAVAIFKNNKSLPQTKTLELRKEVSGSGDVDKNWEFEIRLTPDKESRVMESYSYTGGSFIEGVERIEDSEIKFTKEKDDTYLGTIKLKHGQSVIIQGIEVGISYEIKEKEANHNDYMTFSENAKGIIDDHKLVLFENRKEEIILPEEKTIEIRKEVLRDGDKNKEWEFKITLVPKNNSTSIKDSYSYTGNSFIEDVEKIEDGTINFVEQSDGSSVGKIKLKHGQSITIQGVEVGTNYKIEEVEANQNDYKTIEKNANGKLTKDELVMFANTLTLPDKKTLEIRKEVRGISGDKNKEWEFKIKLIPAKGRKISSSYTYTGISFINGVEEHKDGTINFIKQSDESYVGTIKLKHGEGIIINDLEVGTTYQIIETEANLNHYKLDSLNETGIISQNTLATFQNSNGFTLPKTGELGVIFPVIFGTIFISFGTILFLYINKKKRKFE